MKRKNLEKDTQKLTESIQQLPPEALHDVEEKRVRPLERNTFRHRLVTWAAAGTVAASMLLGAAPKANADQIFREGKPPLTGVEIVEDDVAKGEIKFRIPGVEGIQTLKKEGITRMVIERKADEAGIKPPIPQVTKTINGPETVGIPETGMTLTAKSPMDVKLPADTQLVRTIAADKAGQEHTVPAGSRIQGKGKYTLPSGTQIMDTEGAATIPRTITEEKEVELDEKDVAVLPNAEKPVKVKLPEGKTTVTTPSKGESSISLQAGDEATFTPKQKGKTIQIPKGGAVEVQVPKEGEKPAPAGGVVKSADVGSLYKEVDGMLGERTNEKFYLNIDGAYGRLRDALKDNPDLGRNPQFLYRMGVILGSTGQKRWGDLDISPEQQGLRVTAMGCLNQAKALDATIANTQLYGVSFTGWYGGVQTYLISQMGYTKEVAEDIGTRSYGGGTIAPTGVAPAMGGSVVLPPEHGLVKLEEPQKLLRFHTGTSTFLGIKGREDENTMEVVNLYTTNGNIIQEKPPIPLPDEVVLGGRTVLEKSRVTKIDEVKDVTAYYEPELTPEQREQRQWQNRVTRLQKLTDETRAKTELERAQRELEELERRKFIDSMEYTRRMEQLRTEIWRERWERRFPWGY